MTFAPTIDSLIETNPQLRGGRPIITGTDTAVRTVAGLYKLGLVAEEIGTQLPHLTLAQIYAALAYYHLHRAEIEADIEADAEENLQQLAGWANASPAERSQDFLAWVSSLSQQGPSLPDEAFDRATIYE